MLCPAGTDKTSLPCLTPAAVIPLGADGTFSTTIPPVRRWTQGLSYIDCTVPGAASCAYKMRAMPTRLVVADDDALGSTAVRVPLTFSDATEIPVTSNYEPEYEAIFQQGVSLSGRSPEDLQILGTATSLWLLGSTGTHTGGHLPITGSTAHTTRYSLEDYLRFSSLAASHDCTLDEIQKVGSVFWSWILLGMPPLPH